MRIASRVAFGPHPELLVVKTVEFPSRSKPGRMNAVHPGTVLDPVLIRDGKTIYQPSGWYAAIPIDDVPESSVVNLRDFFQEVANRASGTFIPPTQHRKFVLQLPDAVVITYFDSSRDNWAEVRPDVGEDYEVPLSMQDFSSPEAFIGKVLA